MTFDIEQTRHKLAALAEAEAKAQYPSDTPIWDDQRLAALARNTEAGRLGLAACEEVERLVGAIRKHRDCRGDDRCHLDDGELYAVLPEGDTRPAKDTAVTLENCQQFIECRQQGREYVSPEREMERLRAENATLSRAVNEVDGQLAAENAALRSENVDWMHQHSECLGEIERLNHEQKLLVEDYAGLRTHLRVMLRLIRGLSFCPGCGKDRGDGVQEFGCLNDCPVAAAEEVSK